MRFKLGLKSKMLLFILMTCIVIFIGAFGYMSILFKEKSLNNAYTIANNYSKEYGNLINAKLNEYMLAARTTATAFESFDSIPEEERRAILADVLVQLLKYNDDFISVWSICESNSIDNLDSIYVNQVGSTILGNFRHVYYKDNNEIKLSKYVEQDSAEVFSGKVYTRVKNDLTETLIDPYFYSYTGNKEDEILEANLVIPILKNGKFIGVLGVDITLETFNEINKKIKPFKKGYAYLISNDGTLVAHPDEKMAGKPIDSLTEFRLYPDSINALIKKGSNFSFTINKKTGGRQYLTFNPIQAGYAQTPWSIAISVPLKVILQSSNRSFLLAVFIGVLGLVLLTIVIWAIAGNITKPILKTTKTLQNLAQGEIDSENLLKINTNDEIGDMANAVDNLIQNLERTIDFANQIGKGNLDTQFDLLSDEDSLGYSLIEMRESLKKAREEEELGKIEDQKRNWATQGIAKFGELLREGDENIEELSYKVIKELVDYLDATQCAFFILHDDDPNNVYLELLSTIAFGIRKYIKKTIKNGESLIGRAAEEHKTINLSEIPENYIEITKGVTGKNPDNLLIVPLEVNETVYGVLELISYKKFEAYQAEFVEKIGENIASTIASVKVNSRTNELLEKSKKQADELAQQEEEMRQNMEEMQATQEEAAKREAEMKGLIEGINTITLVSEYDLDGQLTEINDELLRLYGMSKQQVQGKYHGTLGVEVNVNREEIDQLWQDLRKGKTRKRIQQFNINNKSIWLEEIYTPIYDADGDPIKVLNVSVDITERTKMEQEINQLEEDIKEIQQSSQK